MKLATYLVRLAALLLAFPLAASATIYKWTDEHGVTVYSNRAPAAEAKVSNMQVAMQDDDPAPAPKPAAAPRPAANPDDLQARVGALEQQVDLQSRVQALEQQVQALQNQSFAAPPPPPGWSQAAVDPWMSGWGSPGWGWGSPFFTAPPGFIIVNGRRFFRPVFPVHNKFVVVRPGFVKPVGVRPVVVSQGMVASRGTVVASPGAMGASRAMGGARGMSGGGRR